MPAPFPWDEVLRFALGRLRWCPDTVWRATPREIAAALGRPESAGRFDRERLADLMSRFPDEVGHPDQRTTGSHG